jgi:ABC-type glycerol-3-phosphate transport system substrate-binding protein
MRKALLVVSSLMVLMTACDSESTSGPASSRSTPSGEISVQVSGEAEETAVYEAAVNAFEDSNDNISVELIKVADGDHLAKLTTLSPAPTLQTCSSSTTASTHSS